MTDPLDELAEYLREEEKSDRLAVCVVSDADGGHFAAKADKWARWLSALEQVRHLSAVEAPQAPPREPTNGMRAAGHRVLYDRYDGYEAVALVWRAMFDAAPSAQADERWRCIDLHAGRFERAAQAEPTLQIPTLPQHGEPQCAGGDRRTVNAREELRDSPERLASEQSESGAPADEPFTVLAKIRVLGNAIAALEGEEIGYREAMMLSAAARVCREYIKANEADDE